MSFLIDENGRCTLNIRKRDTSAVIYPDYLRTERVEKNTEICFFPFHSYLVDYGSEDVPEIVCIWLEPVPERGHEMYRRGGCFILGEKDYLESLEMEANGKGVMVLKCSASLTEITII
jgi:hypothetical protein